MLNKRPLASGKWEMVAVLKHACPRHRNKACVMKLMSRVRACVCNYLHEFAETFYSFLSSPFLFEWTASDALTIIIIVLILL